MRGQAPALVPKTSDVDEKLSLLTTATTSGSPRPGLGGSSVSERGLMDRLGGDEAGSSAPILLMSILLMIKFLQRLQVNGAHRYGLNISRLLSCWKREGGCLRSARAISRAGVKPCFPRIGTKWACRGPSATAAGGSHSSMNMPLRREVGPT